MKFPFLNSKKIIPYFLLLITALAISSSAKISYSSYFTEENSSKYQFFKPLIKKLLKNGADTAFVYSLIADSKTKFDKKYVKINVTGYLRKYDYSANYSPGSVKKSSKFLKENIDILKDSEKIYSIPKEIITAVIWIETRCGDYLGNNHVPSVFVSTALADRPEYIKMNKKELYKNYNGTKDELKELENKIEKRAVKKANWALKELLALEKMYELSPVPVNQIKGSWAGAFGISQFLPSSYVNWAVDGNSDGIVNLFEVEDAIHSVANYLKTNGWGKSDQEKRKAIYHYNNSSDYVDAVLILATK